MFYSDLNLADIDVAAEGLKVTVAVLKKLIKNNTGPKHVMVNGKPYFDLDDVREYTMKKTICSDLTVIPKVTARVLDVKKRSDGKSIPVLAAYSPDFGNGRETRSLILVSLDGVSRSHSAYKEFGSGDGPRSEGYFLQEVSAPELAGYSDKYLGWNALEPEYNIVKFTS